MNDEERDSLLSQLADGELTSDRLNEVLLDVLGDADARESLKGMLRLRAATSGWRRRRPARGVALPAGPMRRPGASGLPRRLGTLAAAAAVGGMLVLAGFWAADRHRVGPAGGGSAEVTPVAAVTAEQMRQVAEVFALHESVAGPLKWFAADDREIHLGPAEGGQPAGRPVAVLLRFAGEKGDGAPKNIVIVCRDNQQAVVELPSGRPEFPDIRIRLIPRRRDRRVDVQYALAIVRGDDERSTVASLAGDRTIGVEGAALGQLALKDRVFSVGASSWALPEPPR